MYTHNNVIKVRMLLVLIVFQKMAQRKINVRDENVVGEQLRNNQI
jgi:hypothetical protein